MNFMYFRFLYSSVILLLLLGIGGCSTSQKTADDDNMGPAAGTEVANENITQLQILLEENRSKLSDVHTFQNHDMPKVYLKKDSSDVSLNNDPFDGYRIQIISTTNQPLADSVANKFRVWADSTIKGYSADAYIFFRQPYYKVHVGDFQKREQANSFSKLIKRQYPDAWVVHDRIDPEDVPADTASFSFKKEKRVLD